MSADPASVTRISVVIPTFRRKASVERALLALGRQTLSPKSFEVVVSIDGSEDGTRECVAAFPAPYALEGLWRPNGGRAAACNAGIRAARAGLVVLLDDDMEPAPGFLEAHLQAHGHGSRRGVLGAVPVAVEPTSPPVVKFIAGRFGTHLSKLAQSSHRIGIRDFYSGNFSLARGVFLEVGLFDEGFKIYGNEDVELAIRLQAAGIELYFSAEAEARQHYEKDFAALAGDKMAQGRTSVACAMRHPEAIPNLRIGTYRKGPRRWKLLRGALLGLSRLSGAIPKRVLEYVGWLENHRSPKLASRYELALDYFYWLGVQSALREDGAARVRLAL